jgi:hypothetical protein
MGLRKITRRSVYTALALSVLAAALFHGLSFCFCKSNPQSCSDEHCGTSHSHDCHSTPESGAAQSYDHDCLHIEVDAINALALAGSGEPKVCAVLCPTLFDFSEHRVFTYNIPESVEFRLKRMSYAPLPQYINISRIVKVLC